MIKRISWLVRPCQLGDNPGAVVVNIRVRNTCDIERTTDYTDVKTRPVGDERTRDSGEEFWPQIDKRWRIRNIGRRNAVNCNIERGEIEWIWANQPLLGCQDLTILNGGNADSAR